MVRSRDVVQAEGSARTEGARRATGVRADGAVAGAGSLAQGQRWSASRKRDVVLRLLRGESLEALSREAGVEIYRLDAWRERAMAGLELGSKGSTRRSGTSGSCRWRSSCSASGPGPRSSASLWRCGGRDDERDDLRGDGALFRHPAGVSGLGALALGALRAAGAGTPPAGRGAGAAGAGAEAIGRAAAGGDSRRSRAVPVPRRRPSQGPRTASGNFRCRRTRPPVENRRPSSSTRGRDAAAAHDGQGHHPGARSVIVGALADRRAGHARRRVGLDLRGSRTLMNAAVQWGQRPRVTKSEAARRRSPWSSCPIAHRASNGSSGSLDASCAFGPWACPARCGWITGRSCYLHQTISSSRSFVLVRRSSTRSFGHTLSRNPRNETGWLRAPAESYATKEQVDPGRRRIFQNLERRHASPWPTSPDASRYNAGPGVSARSLAVPAANADTRRREEYRAGRQAA